MKRIAALLLLVLGTTAGFAQTTNVSVEAKLSPAERSIAQARKLIENRDYQALDQLVIEHLLGPAK